MVTLRSGLSLAWKELRRSGSTLANSLVFRPTRRGHLRATNRGPSHRTSPSRNHYLPNRTRTPIRRRQLVERDRMKKEMLINVLQPEECRIAIIEDGVLEELYVERTSHESYTGNIYKGRIVNLEPAIQAAFVDFSVGRNGFLHVSDVEPQYFDRPEGPHEPRWTPARATGTAIGSVTRVAAVVATIAAAPHRGRTRSIRRPPGCRRPRLGWKTGPRERGRERDRRIEAASVNAPTSRSRVDAIDPSRRRGGSARAWSSRPRLPSNRL